MKTTWVCHCGKTHQVEQLCPEIQTAQKLRDKYESDLRVLQAYCKHEKSDWLLEEFAPGHSMGKALVCDICWEVLKRE